MAQFTVPQETGLDSTVTVSSHTGSEGQHVTYLNFVTNQSLLVNSNRAWNVCKAIKDYAYQRGYRIDDKDFNKFEAIATYDPSLHSHVEIDKVRDQVKADPHYQKAAQLAEAQAQTINKEYGRATRLLKNLAKALENRQRLELKRVGVQLSVVQREIMDNLFVPPEVNEQDRGRLDKLFVQLEVDHYGRCGIEFGELPDGETLLDLLTLLEDN